MNNAIILEGTAFNWDAARSEIENKKLWETRPEHAAAMSDPGICSCPRCHRNYWFEGIKQRCPKCLAEYETDWWSMLSWGIQYGRKPDKYHRERYKESRVFQWGAAHPDCSLDHYAVFIATNWIEVWDHGREYIKEGEVEDGKIIGFSRDPENKIITILVQFKKHQHTLTLREELSENLYLIDRDDLKDVVVKLEVGDRIWWNDKYVLWNSQHRRTVNYISDVPLDVLY